MGRKKGDRNLVTRSAKEALELAFEGIGGVTELQRWAKLSDSNRATFYTIWSRLIPRQINLPLNPNDGIITFAALITAAQQLNQLPAPPPMIEAKPQKVKKK